MSSRVFSRSTVGLARRPPPWIALALWLVWPASPRTLGADAAQDTNAKRDQARRQLIVGTWTTDEHGRQTMTLREDGTALMIVELRGLQALLFASRLEFDMVWSIENDRLRKRTTGGRPARRVKMVLETKGDRAEEPIVELTKNRLLLLDADGKTKHDWRRAK